MSLNKHDNIHISVLILHLTCEDVQKYEILFVCYFMAGDSMETGL